MKSYYEILEVNQNASYEVIERAYKVLAKKYHPDKWPKSKTNWAENKFKEITEAYYVLSDDNLRKDYDLKIGVDNSLQEKYNNLFVENEKLKQEVGKMKFTNKSKNNSESNSSSDKNQEKTSYIKKYSSAIKTIIHDEINKPQDERSRDLKALILTIIIISILIILFWKVPFLHKLIFP